MVSYGRDPSDLNVSLEYKLTFNQKIFKEGRRPIYVGTWFRVSNLSIEHNLPVGGWENRPV